MPSIRDLAKAKIVVVGDAILDVWVHGRIDRISPEAPVPVFVEERTEDRHGGSMNVYANLKALGCERAFHIAARRTLPIKRRYVVNNQQIFRADKEDCSAIDEREQNRIFDTVSAHTTDVLIISDYAKGVCTPSLCRRLIQWAKKHAIKVVVDPKGDVWSKYEGADILTPNEKEWQEVKTWPPIEAIVVTRGAKGIQLERGLDVVDIPAANTGPVDVTGAGDTVIAVLSAAIAVGFDLEQAARLANAAAGVAVSMFGTATCSLDELEKAIGQPEAKREIIGVANGVFDLLHDGHRHFLRECKMNCDRLFVLINGDEYVRGYKGAYPHDGFRVRMKNVQEHADNVCGFDSESLLLQLMQNIKPDVIFKGEDYRDKPVTGSDLARIHWVARHTGYSSTIERMKKLHPEPIAAEDM